MDIDKFIEWVNEYFVSPPQFIRPEDYDKALAGYQYAKHEIAEKTNAYQRLWRAKNKSQYAKLIEKYRAEDGDFDRRKEYQKKYYQKRKAAAKIEKL